MFESNGIFRGAALVVALTLSGGAAQALTVEYAGSWQVDDGPSWTDRPLAYTGQEAAALLFGGVAGDYMISTVSADIADIDNLAWYSILGWGAEKRAEDYFSKIEPGGLYYDGGGYPTDSGNPASAYVSDIAEGTIYTNYAFRITDAASPVPLPAAGFLLIGGIGALTALRRRTAA